MLSRLRLNHPRATATKQTWSAPLGQSAVSDDRPPLTAPTPLLATPCRGAAPPRQPEPTARVISAGPATGAGEWHVASLIVHARPERLAEVTAAILTLPGAEIPTSDAAGKLVVTLEAASERPIARALDQINAWPGVLSATLVYHEVDAGPPEAQEASA
jgi:nitrate reductase NapD